MKSLHAYHLYVGAGDWRRVALEHFRALEFYGFDGDIYVGLVGSEAQRRRARVFLTQVWPAAKVLTETEEGFEQVTLSALYQTVQELEPCTPVLYAHTKGSTNVSTEQDMWRACMGKHVIGKWRACVEALKGCDAVGAHWVTEATALEYFGKRVPDFPPHFGGNFWWATAGYLASLQDPAEYRHTRDRWDAEWWVGSGKPEIVNLESGWAFHPHQKPEGKTRVVTWRPPGAVR